MTSDPWAVPAHFYSIIVKRGAVVRSFPGGPEEFERLHQPSKKNGALYLLTVMSLSDAEQVLASLSDQGVLPGKDVAVVDMVQGPLLECSGLTFTSEGEGLETRWWVNVVARPPQAVQEPRRIVATLVHHLYSDTGPDELVDRPCQSVASGSDQPEGTMHTIKITYTYGVVAAQGQLDDALGEHSVLVDGATYKRILAGETVSAAGQGFQALDETHDDEWLFNAPARGWVAFFADDEDYVAVDLWHDGRLMPRPDREV